MVEERALVGAKEIAEYLRVSVQTVNKYSKELQKQGVLLKLKLGRPPYRKKRLYTFPSLLQRYLISISNSNNSNNTK